MAAKAGWDFLQKKTLFVLVSKRFKGMPYIIFFVLDIGREERLEEKGPKKSKKRRRRRRGSQNFFVFFFIFWRRKEGNVRLMKKEGKERERDRI